MRRHGAPLLLISILVGVINGVSACDNTAPRGPGAIAVAASATAPTDEGVFFQYGIAIDNGTPRTAFVGQPLLFTQPGLAHGQHTVSVTGMSSAPSNCTGAESRDVAVQGDDTTNVIINIVCPSTMGTLRFVTATAGPDGDPDGLVATVGTRVVRTLPNGAADVRLAAGTHNYVLSDVQPNCTLSGSASGSVTVTVGATTTVTVNLTCTAIGMGTMAFTTSEPTADTLPNDGNAPSPAHDIVGVTGRYAPGFLIFVTRFTKPVASSSTGASSALHGFIEFDTDENGGTGIPPVINAYGGSAQMGTDYVVSFFENDNVSAELLRSTGTGSVSVVGRVLARYEGDSVIVLIPLAKIADDGNLAAALTLGTEDRPTDIMPNTGVIIARAPAAIVADRAMRSREPVAPGRTLDALPSGKWKMKP
jgi:hypothetical protein